MTTPTTDRAYAAGEDAPEGLMAVEVKLARRMAAQLHVGGKFYADGIDDTGEFDGTGSFGGPFATLAACEAWIERKTPERTITYYVGLDPDVGAVNVSAAIQRAEADNPSYEAVDWGAA